MTVKKIDGEMYRQMLCGAALSLQSKKDEINNLNVFPVPDGDTGTNMSMTLDAVRAPAAKSSRNLAEYAASSAREIMRAARGNSGVILSLFFRGVARTFSGHEDADAELVTEAFRAGAEDARKAVLKPVEGTILTVMRECCALPEELHAPDMNQLLDNFCRTAQETLKKTPDMLPALKKAKVVDSGGSGFTAVLDGMKRVLNGESFSGETGTFLGTVKTEPAADFSEFETEDIRFSFCTECLVAKAPGLSDNLVAELRPYLAGMGDSVVMTDDDEIIKIHIHTNEPLTVLSHVSALGELQLSKIENMRLQHDRLAAAKVQAAAETIPLKACGVVVVSNGAGINDVFGKLGAERIIAGGQSMNPSADDFLKAIKAIRCERVVLLPNNPNIVLTARQAAELAEGVQVDVVPSVTIPQGISALLAYNPGAEPAANLAAMNAALGSVTTLSVTRAVKDADTDGLPVKKRQFIGLVNNKLRYASDSLDDCLRSLAPELSGRELVTVYYGKGVKSAEAEHVAALLGEALGDGAEICVVSGQQPIYSYLISAE